MQFNISLLSVILLSLLRIEKTVATPKDAFAGISYGFKCITRVYEKSYVYAAAKELCQAKARKPGLSFRRFDENRSPDQWTQLVMKDLKFSVKKPLSLIPLLDDGTVFPMDKPTVENYNSDTDGIYPGLDRLVIDKDCKVVGAFYDYGPITDSPRRYTKCTVLKYPLDHPFSSENPPDPVDPNELAFNEYYLYGKRRNYFGPPSSNKKKSILRCCLGNGW